jgi:biopolymer transport protein ExbD
MANNKVPEINASSMADVAFLLLIFFLVTTTVDADKGLGTYLPPFTEQPPIKEPKKPRNVFNVLVNSDNKLLVRGEEMKLEDLRTNCVKFLTSNGSDPNLPESLAKAIVVIKNDRGTNYKTFLSVYSELKAAYATVNNTNAQAKFGKAYESLTKAEKDALLEQFPYQPMGEMEPTRFGKELGEPAPGAAPAPQ